MSSYNRFAILTEDESQVESTVIIEQKKPQVANAPVDKSRAQPGERRSTRKDYPQRGGASVGRVQRDSLDKRDVNFVETRTENTRGGKKPLRGGRGGKGRENDRHSATGKDDSHKKTEMGWGETTPVLNADAAPESPVENAEEVEVKEVEIELKTLDQYYAEMAKIKLPSLPPKRAVDSDIKGAILLEKKEEYFYIGKQQEKQTQKKQKDKPVKQAIPINNVFATPRTYDKSKKSAGPKKIDINDQKAFPVLGR